jgi:hypothetical protein
MLRKDTAVDSQRGFLTGHRRKSIPEEVSVTELSR